MKRSLLPLLLAFGLLPAFADAATHFVRPGATGRNASIVCRPTWTCISASNMAPRRATATGRSSKTCAASWARNAPLRGNAPKPPFRPRSAGSDR